MSVFLCVVIAFGYVLSQAYGNPSILYLAVLFSVGTSITSYWFSDKIALSMHGAQPVSMENAPELYRIVENLAITAGLPTPRIYIIPEAAPNAFATGRDPKHSVVAVTRGLLEKLDRSELEGVLAHEMAHIGNRDMLIGTVAVVLVGFISIASDFFSRSLMFRGGGDRDNKNGIFMIIGILLSILAPLAATIMQLAISRKREYLADVTGALMTRYPEGLANALQKISSDHTPMARANNATAHLWLSSPFKDKGKPSRLAELFLTHPPIEKRIAALRGMKA